MSFKSRPKPETFVVDVDPGDETGVYYITICNLPFGTTWRSFKDWARSACEIDHVAIFPTSTSGWVRVLGRESFDKAWALLNGGNYEGRSIIASDRNAFDPIKIKELVKEPSVSRGKQPTRSTPSTSPTSSRATYSSQTHGSQTEASSASQPAYSNTSRSQEYGLPSSSTGAYQHPNSAGRRQRDSSGSYSRGSTDLPSSGRHGRSDSSHHGRTSSRADEEAPRAADGSPADVPAHAQGASGSPQDLATYSAVSDVSASRNYYEGGKPEYVETEARKILVTNIERKDKAADVTAWLRRKIGHYATHIVDLDLPRNEAKRQLRGHAYIVFQTSHAATRAIDRLNGQTLHNRTLAARLTNEGVSQARDDYAGYGCSVPIIAHGSMEHAGWQR